MNEKPIMELGIFILIASLFVTILDWIINGITIISGYFVVVGFIGFMTFMFGIYVGVINNE